MDNLLNCLRVSNFKSRHFYLYYHGSSKKVRMSNKFSDSLIKIQALSRHDLSYTLQPVIKFVRKTKKYRRKLNFENALCIAACPTEKRYFRTIAHYDQ